MIRKTDGLKILRKLRKTNMYKKVRIIGDLHGRSNWHQLVEPIDTDTMYVFLGDFTDPYYGWENVTRAQMFDELKKAIEFKRAHPDNVIILASNHDYQYIANDPETNRYSYQDAPELHKIFTDNVDIFTDAAYQIGEKYLISHAGVTKDWYQKHIDYVKDDITLQEICDQINKLWREDKKAFSFGVNATKFSDYYGDSATHSPIWIRPASLWQNNILGFGSGKIQIVGHTRFDTYEKEKQYLNGHIATYSSEKIEPNDYQIEHFDQYINDGEKIIRMVDGFDTEHPDIIFIDCLEAETACVEIDTETLTWKKIIVEENKEKDEK